MLYLIYNFKYLRPEASRSVEQLGHELDNREIRVRFQAETIYFLLATSFTPDVVSAQSPTQMVLGALSLR